MDVASFGAALLAVSLIAQQPPVGLARPSGLGTLVDGFRCMRRQAIQVACTSRHSGSSGQRRSRRLPVGSGSVSHVPCAEVVHSFVVEHLVSRAER